MKNYSHIDNPIVKKGMEILDILKEGGDLKKNYI